MNDISTQSEHEEIASLAHEIYQSTGCPEGCAEQHWLQAEHTLKNRKQNGHKSKRNRDKQD
ncbi:MAG: DUF2934 domain-containing protein [Chthoniobacterales bacterium]